MKIVFLILFIYLFLFLIFVFLFHLVFFTYTLFSKKTFTFRRPLHLPLAFRYWFLMWPLMDVDMESCILFLLQKEVFMLVSLFLSFPISPSFFWFFFFFSFVIYIYIYIFVFILRFFIIIFMFIFVIVANIYLFIIIIFD